MRPSARHTVFLVALASGLSGPGARAEEGSELEEATPAPEVRKPGEPTELELSPPPSAEKGGAMSDYVELTNPLFPVAPKLRVVSIDRGLRFDASSLAPYFATPALSEARAAYERGAYARALELLSAEPTPSPAVRYLLGVSALRAGKVKLAAATLEALAPEYPALADRCVYHAALAYEQAGEVSRAASLLEQVPQSSRLYFDARVALASALRRRGALREAIDALAPLAKGEAPGVGRDVAAEALAQSAELYRQLKEPQAARDALLTLWATHPRSSEARRAERLLGPLAQIPLAYRVRRAEALVDANRNQEGLRLLKPLLPSLPLKDPGDVTACHAHFVHGKALRKERSHSLAIAALEPVAERCRDPELLPRALYVLGSSQSIVQLEKAPATYERLAREFPAHSFADDALFYSADAHARLGDRQRALARLGELVDRYPSGDFVGEALFRTFWVQREAGELNAALATLDRLESAFRDAEEPYERERGRYWRARVLEQKGQGKEAAVLLESLTIAHPSTYYGTIARERLERLTAPTLVSSLAPLPSDAAPATARPWPLYAGAMSQDPRFLAAVELLRMGFREVAAAELLGINRAGLSSESRRLLVHLFSLTGDTRAAHAIARSVLRAELSGPITDENRFVFEIAYPLAFRPLVERHCAAAGGLDPDLLQALMREESALDPKALSWAGALGLTQLMPYTARALARQLKLRAPSRRALFNPDLNIRLGAHYLSSLTKRFDGNLRHALASYNAGAGAVDRWRAERSDADIDAFVETIPIAETRGYVKRVLRTYHTYRRLYGRPPKSERVTER